MKLKLIAIVFLFLFACQKVQNPADSFYPNQKIYTLYNIHYDTNGNRVFTTNYQQSNYHQGPFIPVCTEIELISLNEKIAKFRVKSEQKDYSYMYHKAVGEALKNHLSKAFGPNCNQDEIKTLSQVDQKGIKNGKPHIGMSKKGILYAMGRPPVHVTPNIDSNEWLYWENRFNKTLLVFDDNDLLIEIRK